MSPPPMHLTHQAVLFTMEPPPRPTGEEERP